MKIWVLLHADTQEMILSTKAGLPASVAGNWPESAWPWPTALVKYELGHLRLTSTSEKWNLEVLRFQSQWPSWLKDEQTSLDQGLTKSEIGYIDPKSDNWEEV